MYPAHTPDISASSKQETAAAPSTAKAPPLRHTPQLILPR
ncbi:hypothetical protein OROMI_003465 [Orobanche minor]